MRVLIFLLGGMLAGCVFAEASPSVYTGLQFTARPVQTQIQTTGFTLAWSTNQPARAILLYGDAGKFVSITSDSTVHACALQGLEPGTIYRVQVAAILGQDTVFADPQWFATQSSSSGQIKVYFNQGIDLSAAAGLTPDGSTFQDVLAETLARINAAQHTIDVAMYNNNRSDITSALKQAHNRGVRVRYIGAAATDNSALTPAPAFPVLLGNTDALMHDKFMITDVDYPDDCWVMSGSLNWTNSNMVYDYNNTLFIQDQSLARAYVLEFEEMWGSSGNQPNPSAARFGSSKIDNTPHNFIIGGRAVESWFSPSDKVTQRIVAAIRTADTKASFAIFSFTRNEIGNAFIEVHDKGVWVRGIIENINDPGAEIDWLLSHQVPVVPHPGNNLLHHKYAVLDAGYPAFDPQVVTGSHNWTTAAETSNDENTLVIHDADLAVLYQAEFERRWAETTTATGEPNVGRFAVFPNPATDQLTIHLNSGEAWSGGVVIRNQSGQVVAEYTLRNAQSPTILLGPLRSGIYYLTLTTDHGNSAVSFQTLLH